jgi:hypothetical protein
MSYRKSGLEFRKSNRGGWEYSDDNGANWYLTFRSESAIREMHPDLIDETIDTSDMERELFGETLDEPLPDDLAAMLGID